MSGVRLNLDGQDEATAAFAALGDRAQSARGMYENIGMSLVTSTLHRFETGTGPDGSPWPPSLRVLAHGGKTLVETARLMRSITYQAADRSVEVGTNVLYAAIHQLGGSIDMPARQQTVHFKTSKRTGQTRFSKAKGADRSETFAVKSHVINMPARPFLGIDDDDEREISRIAETWLAGQDGTLQ